ncbi:uncharacterized protein LOC142768550 [Rhipicephalus microplus]|uniref:uncharacterized protein LOC142768550 n=1 Tax=Rhipicephalus microplus TaxID=6941 RepID=UPI003F6ADEFD
MTYVDAPCLHLSRVPQHDLGRLDEQDLPSLPRLGDKTVPQAIISVRVLIQSMTDMYARLHFAAHLYSIVANMGIIRPWALYLVGQIKDRSDVIGDILKKMRRNNVFGAFTKATENAYCSCLLVAHDGGGHDYKPNLLATWRTKPFIAVHESPEGQSPSLASALRQVFGPHLESFRCGVYQDLMSAHAVVVRLFP